MPPSCALKNDTFYILPHKIFFLSKCIPTSKHFPYRVGCFLVCSLFASEGDRHPARNMTPSWPPFSSPVAASSTPRRSPASPDQERAVRCSVSSTKSQGLGPVEFPSCLPLIFLKKPFILTIRHFRAGCTVSSAFQKSAAVRICFLPFFCFLVLLPDVGNLQPSFVFFKVLYHIISHCSRQ